MGIFDWLFPPSERQQPEPQQPSVPPRSTSGKTFKLVEADFDPDGDKSDFMWSGFHIHDDRDIGLSYDDAESLFKLVIFRVAGVSHRVDALQHSEFEPGNVLKLIAETNNPYDRNAVSVWDRSGSYMIGYVPKERNKRVRAAMQLPGHAALALAEHRKGGRRVSLTVCLDRWRSNRETP